MSLSTKNLYFRIDGVSYPVGLFSSTSDLRDPTLFMAIRVGGETLYADAGGSEGRLHIRKDGSSLSMDKEYSIGDTGPAGGTIFYDKGYASNGWRFLEAWTTDEDVEQWKTSDTFTGGTSTAIGTGYENTYDELNNSTHPAGRLCATRTYGGYNDWFLPSLDEIHQLYLQKAVVGGFTGFMSGAYRYYLYWTSSEADSSNEAYNKDMDDGDIHDNRKTFTYKIRAIRRF